MMRTVMENAGLAFWPSLSLLIFGTSCIAMVLWVFRSGSTKLYRDLSTMALEDGKDVLVRPLGAPQNGKR